MLHYVTDILRVRGQRTVQVCKVKGHATEDMVARGRVRQADLEGYHRADETADFGRRRQDDGVATARRVCLQACRDWYPLIMHLHRCFIGMLEKGTWSWEVSLKEMLMLCVLEA